MDPLLKSLSDSTLRQLVQEQRPAWAVPLGQGRADVAAPAEQAGPPLPQELGTYRRAASQAYEAGKDPLNAKDPFYKRAMRAILALGDPRALEDIPSATSVGEGFFNPAFGAAGILAGPKAAKQLGGLAEAKFHAGRAALERGDAPQAVWRTWGVARTKEGNYVFEPPLMETESEAIDQFRKLYPKETLRVLRGSGSREGYYDHKAKEVYARGDPKLPGGNFQSRRTVLEHELQHAVDDAEGVSYGTNLQDPKYHQNAAEVRARATEMRLDKEQRVWEPSMHEDVDRMDQVIKRHPLAVAEAVKEPGGMWHPEAVERLANPLKARLWDDERDTTSLAIGQDWAGRAIRNYLNKYAGTERDPLKDVEVPVGQDIRKWGALWDEAAWSDEAHRYGTDLVFNKNTPPKERIWEYGYQDRNRPLIEMGAHPSRDIVKVMDAGRDIQSYLSHVGDYLRQNVKPEKLAQYDLVRAVKETAANDARVAKEMEKAAQASMKDMPVYKEYPDGMKWVELKKPEKLSERQVKGVREASEEEIHAVLARETDGQYDYPEQQYSVYLALGADGKPIKNSYTGGLASGGSPEEAYLAGQLAQEGNQMGHCVGGYCEGVASGESKIFSLRDAKGKSHVTIEVQPPDRGDSFSRMPDSIVQIKGKQNRAPNAEYLPYVQDFVKGGKWGEVGDLGNTRLERLNTHSAIPWGNRFTWQEIEKLTTEFGGGDKLLRAAQKDLGSYVTQDEFEAWVLKQMKGN